jgi:hypothetical protein
MLDAPAASSLLRDRWTMRALCSACSLWLRCLGRALPAACISSARAMRHGALLQQEGAQLLGGTAVCNAMAHSLVAGMDGCLRVVCHQTQQCLCARRNGAVQKGLQGCADGKIVSGFVRGFYTLQMMVV